jgi:rhamnogalacturonan endolyase
MKRNTIILAIITFAMTAAFAQSGPLKVNEQGDQKGKLIYTADFEKGIDTSEWIAEIEPDAGSSVYAKDGKLQIDTKGGVTVWLKKHLKGNIQIEYKRTVLMDGNPNDRLSDLNQFWMAEDPRNSKLFTRSGGFAQYDSLRLYYVGMGGNSNTTTRFRKYQGNGQKTLLQEYKDEDHLLKVGKKYLIKIIVSDRITSFWVDDECYFTYVDPEPLYAGYFGFRSVHSRQEIEDFKIYQLP